MSDIEQTIRRPGVCIPWEEKRKEIKNIQGDEEVFRRVWQDVDAMAYMYIWHILVSF